MWNCWECCKCFRQSPKNNVWGYACDAAKDAGFRNIPIQYWVDSDPYRPKEWDKSGPGFTPGPISIYSTLCEQCMGITLKEYFDMLSGFRRRHDYCHHGGAGVGSNMCYRSEGCFDSYTVCANCRREQQSNRFYEYNCDLKAGWIIVGTGEHDSGATGMSFCTECPRKLTINDVRRLYTKLKPIHDKEWSENWNKWEAQMEEKWGPDWRKPKEDGWPDDDTIGSD